jgi:hypothetical protein
MHSKSQSRLDKYYNTVLFLAKNSCNDKIVLLVARTVVQCTRSNNTHLFEYSIGIRSTPSTTTSSTNRRKSNFCPDNRFTRPLWCRLNKVALGRNIYYVGRHYSTTVAVPILYLPEVLYNTIHNILCVIHIYNMR